MTSSTKETTVQVAVVQAAAAQSSALWARYSRGLSLRATLDLGEIGRGKFDFDVAGHYSRPDVFQLHVNEAPQRPVVAKTGD